MNDLKTNNFRRNYYIIYDGECVVCSRFIGFLDRKSSKTRYNIYVMPEANLLPCKDIDLQLIKTLSSQSIILVDDKGNMSIRSNAIINIFKITGDKFLGKISILMSLFPRIFSDIIYIIFSKVRRKLFIRNSCKLARLQNIYILS